MRLFVAVWPAEAVTAQLAALARPELPGVRWTTPDQWHVTLRFLGSVEDPSRVKAALAQLDRAGAVTALAGPTVERLGRGILCLPVAGLEDLARAVGQVTAGIGDPLPDRPFHGHLTLARARRGADLGRLAGAPLVAAWPVDSVTLVASETHPHGARYRILDQVALG